MGSLKDIKASYRVVVKGLVRDENGRLLFVRERSETWDLPGGGLEHGEEALEALEREFSEELNVGLVTKTGSPHVFPSWNTKFDDPVLILAYDASIDGSPALTADVQEFGYFSLEDAKNANLDSTLPQIIETLYAA